VALLPLITSTLANKEDKINIIDVGTGGGFPGLPLALLLPQYQFTLADSVQKKLVAVSEMASELDISNVRIHCGRVEEMYTDNSSNNNNGRREHYKRYDIVLGRSVTALPRFCAWISNLLKEDGKLIYIIGGELEEVVTSHIEGDMPIDSLLQREEGTSDKRALIFGAESVEQIAEESGEKLNVVRSGGQKTKKIQSKTSPSQGKKLAKGEWSKKRNDVKKDRGYDDFKRYEF
jgi:16S rRNA (guanine(527)-N(7))-methyltransferase RsmG